MLSTYTYPKYDYVRPAALDQTTPETHPVVVVGAGPVGLAAALDLAQQGLQVLLLDEDDTVSIGSRGVCYAKRTLEILDRLGCGDPMVDKGVSWNVGRTFFREEEVFHFNLRPEEAHERPGMINLQQYYLEQYLIEHAQDHDDVAIRFRNKVTQVQQDDNGVLLDVETPDGSYQIRANWLVVADGARSPIRHMLGLPMEGQVFKDRFLIADVVMKADFPAERWFWFDPPFHRNQSVLLHRQADNVWRIDFQLGWDADPEEAKKPENVLPRIQAMLGPDHPFELEWVSVYTFQCRRMRDFRAGRVLFVGDAAHQVSPFGARGANSGIQDTDNLAWKLAMVERGLAPAQLLDTYSSERVAAANENLMNSTRSTDFITPKSPACKAMRNAVLDLAAKYPFARALVNSGRLSVPAHLLDSPLNTPDADRWDCAVWPGSPLPDAPVQSTCGAPWLLRALRSGFHLLVAVDDASQLSASMLDALQTLRNSPIAVEPVIVARQGQAPQGLRTLIDTQGLLAQRCDLRPGNAWLVRPDQHLAARWRAWDSADVLSALRLATAQPASAPQPMDPVAA